MNLKAPSQDAKESSKYVFHIRKDPVMLGAPPNISGAIKPYSSTGGNVEGAFLSEPGNSTASRGSGNGINILLDASSVSSIYGASPTVQPSSLRVLACIKT